ncbi:hypothetical protein GGR50DRAFT_380655 [Xylaria sp. CBS 124048]|nr:hypothetical protein GGR50DRAFT_380655 [Xylaria sp. CBS 124048]
MLSSLTNLVHGLTRGPEERRVKRYLDEATCDSVCHDLGEQLSPEPRSSNNHLRKTFDEYCVTVSPQQKYWNELCFRNYIRSRHGDREISNAGISILWRSFHFYAFHPFPRQVAGAPVDFEAFERAILLNVFQCDGFLGTCELDWFWRKDATFFRKASFARIFRSIAVPDTASWAESTLQQSDDIVSSLNDAMDALVMVVPHSANAVPTGEQLGAVAWRLFSEGHIFARGPVERGDMSILLSLLLRLRLRERKWGLYYSLGHITETTSADKGIVKALVDSLAGNESEETMEPEEILKAVDIMPNLLLRFQQLWAVLFQPLGTDGGKQRKFVTTRESLITGTLSLFVPYIKTPNGYHERLEDKQTRITLQEIPMAPFLRDMTMDSLDMQLSDESSGYVMIFTADATPSSPKKVVGAYFPSPAQMLLDHDTKDGAGRGNNSYHVVFELEPKFKVLRWLKYKVLLHDLIQTPEGLSLRETATERMPGAGCGPYQLGNLLKHDPGLRVNPVTRTVTLTSGYGYYYMDVTACGSRSRSASDTTILEHPRMDVYKLNAPQRHTD